MLKKLTIDIVRANNPELADTFEAIASRQWSNEVDQMIAVAAKGKAVSEDDEEDRLTYQNNRSQALAKVLNPVKLTEAVEKEYNAVFFPSAKTDVLEPLEYIAQLSAYIFSAMSFLRYLMNEASYLSTEYMPWTDQMKQYEDRFFSGSANFAGSATVKGFSTEDLIRTFLSPERASSGDTHMIRESEFFKEGIDFIITGAKSSVGSAMGMIPHQFGDQTQNQFMVSQESMLGDPKYLNTFASKRCQQVLTAYREVLDILFGNEQWKKYAFSGGMSRLSLTFDPTNMQRRIESALEVPVAELAAKMPKPLAGSTRLKYNHMAVVATPLGNWLQRAPETEERLKTLMENMSDMYTTLGMSVGVCPVFSVPRNIAEYICQVQPTEQLSYVSLNQWFSIWSRQLLVPKRSKSVVGGRLKPMSIPRYVLPLSKAMAATQVRKQEGMYSEPGRTDSMGLYINHRGLPEVLPSAEERDNIVVAADYEKRSEELLRAVFESGLIAKNAGSRIVGTTREMLRSGGKGMEDIDGYNQSLDAYKKDFSGATLYYDWDTNLHYTVPADDPTSARSRSLAGSARPTATVIADLLGYDFAKPGERSIRKLAFETLYMINPSTYTGARKAPEEMMLPQNLMSQSNEKSPFTAIISTYCYLLGLGKATSIGEIVSGAIAELNIRWEPAQENNEQYDIYNTLINKEKVPNIGPSFLNETTVQSWLHSVLRTTWNESMVTRGSVTERTLRRLSQMSNSNYYDMLADVPYRFDPMTDTLGDIQNVYKLLGGEIFRRVCDAVIRADKKALFGQNEESHDPVNAVHTYRSMPSNVLSTFVLPHALLLGHYAPARDSIFAEAEASVERTQPDQSITEEDIKVAGAIEGSMMFPHQVKCHKTLRKRPEFALLDVAPGGGKTSLGITDIGAMLEELQDGHFRPLILCPDGLIPNWCNDARLFFGNKWNMIPLNSDIYRRWGEEKLTQLIKTAPRNTILVCGVHFLSSVGKDRYYVGGGVVTVSPTVEFIKQFQPNYIGIDESHWFKNPDSTRTALIRSITTASHVEYLRLFTGTFIANRVDDALGQTSLFNAAALRREDIFGDENLKGGDTNPETVREGAQRARRKLETHGAVIRATRKEWAFLLAQPIERFIMVDLEYGTDDMNRDGTPVSQMDIEMSKLHDALYSVVMERSLEEIKKLAEQAKKTRGGDDDDDDDGGGSGGGDDDLGLDDDDPLGVLTPEQLKPYLQRIERLITSPEKDPLFEEIFGAAGVTKYVPRKVKEIYGILEEHFKPDVWNRGQKYKELDLTYLQGKLYLARKLDLSTPNRMLLSDSTVGVSPDQLTEVWREEPEGKVIIFTRYKNTVDSIYENLPEKFKKMAVPYHGGLANAKGNLHLFKNDPKIKILVANEQSIKEGHNMQMASRIIRVEWPWTPGDLEQSKSRILRPDVKANKDMIKSGKAGELFREAIFLDWVIANKTMEVDKHARLIWKTVEKAYFDEDNPENLKELDQYELSPVRLSLENLKERTDISNNGGAFSEYYAAYTTVNAINRREFHEMRIKETPSMRMLPTGAGTEMPKDSGKVNTPFVAGIQLVDDKNYGLIDAMTFVQMEQNSEYLENPRELVGKPVITDMGPGIIVRAQPKYMAGDEGGKARKRDEAGNLIVDPMNPIASIKVQLAGTDETVVYSRPELVFIATDVDIKTQRSVFEKGRAPKIEKEADDREDRRQREKATREAQDKDLRERQDRVRAAVEKDNRQQGDQRRANVQKGKPINAGVTSKIKKVDQITREDRAAVRMGKDAAPAVEHHITLHPATFHEYLVLEMETDAEEWPTLKEHGFRETGEYVYITTDRYQKFDKMLDYMDQHFHLSPQSAKRLEVVQDAFEESKAALYRHELAPHSSLPLFFNIRKKIVTDKKEVRPYPILLPREIMIAIDIATCPGIKKHIGKAVPGTGQKWTVSPGNTLYFANNKADMRAKVKELQKAGYIIDNLKELEAEIENVKFRTSSGKK